MKGIRFRPEQEGLRAALFDLEADIMEVVWSKGWAQFSVSDVHRELERGRTIAYTTVMTTVARLHEKEILSREREGRRYVYLPMMTHRAFSEAIARDLLHSFSGFGHDHAMAMLVDEIADSDEKELQKLEALIQKRKEELGK